MQLKNNFGLNFKLRHIHSFKNGNDMSQKFKFKYKTFSKDFDINANKDYYSFENLLDVNNFNNINSIKSKQLSYNLDYNLFLKKSFIKLYLGNILNWYDYKSISSLNSYNESFSLNYQKYYLGIKYKYDGVAIHYITNLSINYFNDEKHKPFVYPEFGLNFTYLFNLNHSITFGSRIFNSTIWGELYLNKKHLLNLYEIDNGSNLHNKFYPTYLFFINYSNYIKKRKFYYNINLNLNNDPYDVYKEVLTLTPFTRLITQSISAKQTNYFADISINKKISKRINFSLDIDYQYFYKHRTYDNIEINKGKNLSFDTNIFSNFKNSLCNLSLGITGKKNYFSIKNNNYNYYYFSPYLELFNKINHKFFWKIKYRYDNYTFFNNKKFINASFLFKYTLKNKFEVSLVGNNIFNIGTQQIIIINNTDNFVEQKKIEILPGYIGIKLKKSF